MKIIICGASGYFGSVLAPFLCGLNHNITLISRSALDYSLPSNAQYVNWDGETLGEWSNEFDNADAIINLSGRTVNCRYNEENKRQILESRINTTRLVARAITQARKPPSIWLNSASATIYRNEFERDMDEETGVIGEGFSVEVCKAWEAALFEEDLPSTRRVAMRQSMIFGRSAPVFNVFANLSKLFLGGSQGNGKQYVSWIHERDCLRATLFLLENNLSGPVNVCSPTPLTNREFQKVVRESFGVKIGLSAPALAMEVGAYFMRTETELALKSRRVVPKRLLDAGFKFEFPTWKAACNDIVHTSK
jgi:uncharacterized protein (TIGR01777 family)